MNSPSLLSILIFAGLFLVLIITGSFTLLCSRLATSIYNGNTFVRVRWPANSSRLHNYAVCPNNLIARRY